MAHTVTIECPNYIVAKAFAMLAQDNCLQNLINTELDRVGKSEYKINTDDYCDISVSGNWSSSNNVIKLK